MDFKRVGLFLVIISGILSISNWKITGAVVGTQEGNVLNILSVSIFLIGLGLIIIRTEYESRSKEGLELVAYVPRVCLKKGINPGGWDPDEQVVPAFDPRKFKPEQIKNDFRFGGDRTLVRIKGESARNFYERPTGLDNKARGIYASEDYVPPKDIEEVDERNYAA